MKRLFAFIPLPTSLLALLTATAAVHAESGAEVISSIGTGTGSASYLQFNDAFTGNWQHYSEVFIGLQGTLFSRVFLLVIVLLPVVFFFHYLIIGPKKFDHTGSMVKYFGIFSRLIHWIAAISFSVLVVTGLMVIFGKYIGGGSPVMTGRMVHLGASLVFCFSAVFMFLMWVKDMLPTLYDLHWMVIMGGYLSKKKKPVPAGRFNAGQKMWFWLATVGGGVMAYTGYQLWLFQPPAAQLQQMVIIHNFLGAGLVGFFLIHLYMSLFAIKGALRSMITGSKPLEEVRILHSRYTKSLKRAPRAG